MPRPARSWRCSGTSRTAPNGMDPVSSMASRAPAVALRRKGDGPHIKPPFVSHPLHTMPDNRKHQRFGPDVDRHRTREHIVEMAPSGVWLHALASTVVAAGEGPAGGARAPRFSRSSPGSGR